MYAVRPGSTASYPSLAYVLVSFNGEVGIGTSLPAALRDALPLGSAVGGGDGEPADPGGG